MLEVGIVTPGSIDFWKIEYSFISRFRHETIVKILLIYDNLLIFAECDIVANHNNYW